MASTKPINILKNNSINSIDNRNPSDILNYIYKLTLKLKDNTTRNYLESKYSKYCNIFSYLDMIKFNTIDSYELEISIYTLCKDKQIYSTIQKFNIEDDYNIYKNDDFYIEFIQNSEGYTSCCCYIQVYDNSRLFITPPNY